MFVDDATRLRHMLDAASEALDFAEGKEQSVIHDNGMLYHAIKDCLSIIGEAAFRISKNYRDAHPEIDWRDLIRLRNELVHDYFIVDPDAMWTTVTDRLPQLVTSLQPLVHGD